MDCSFAPDGLWFVFDATSDQTLKTGFKTKAQAVTWIHTKANDR